MLVPCNLDSFDDAAHAVGVAHDFAVFEYPVKLVLGRDGFSKCTWIGWVVVFSTEPGSRFAEM